MILITGATGRIGNHLTKTLLEQGEKIRIFSRTEKSKSLENLNVQLFRGDITIFKDIESALEGVDEVFHLAGYINISNRDRELTYDINIGGTTQLAKLCNLKNINLYYTSSIHAFIPPGDGSVITENTPLSLNESKSRGIYDYSKAMGTTNVLKEIQNGLKAVIFFPTGVIGPYDFGPSLFGKGMISLIHSNYASSIDGQYDYVDVRDVVEAMLTARKLEKFGQTYILSGNVMHMKEYVSYLKEVTNIHSKTFIYPRLSAIIFSYIKNFFDKHSEFTPYTIDTLNSNCNISHEKATSELNYNPRLPKESINDQYIWFRDNGYL